MKDAPSAGSGAVKREYDDESDSPTQVRNIMRQMSVKELGEVKDDADHEMSRREE